MDRCKDPLPPPAWEHRADEELLAMRLCELRLGLRYTQLQPRLEQLYRELWRAGITFRPHAWLSEEWFSPDGVPGFAIPFYLAHPRLARLERSQMLECEGAAHAECLRIMRHEAGHALDNAYVLHERELWRTTFGEFDAPYPEHYHPAPASREYVVHLNAWYAQAHPAEDFAETFAVWLADPKKNWRHAYEGWPALAKIQAVEDMMESIARKDAPNAKRRRVQPLSACRTTLAEHYRRKREFYEVGLPTHYDADLLRVFAPQKLAPKIDPAVESKPDVKPPKMRASKFLQRFRRAICSAVAQTSGVHHYTVDQLLQRMILRARQLSLVLVHDEQTTRHEFASLLTTQVLHAAHHGHARIPL